MQTIETESRSAAAPQAETPENGLAGLKHWRHDLLAGLIVSLVSVPLSLGIAIASGAPPISGLISSIIAGLVFPFLGGAYVTISGPAAGLAPVVFASMMALGGGHLDVGYRLVLAAISIAGFFQMFLCYIRAARFSAMFPASVIEGMLASIGLMIIIKQMPNFIGEKFNAHEILGVVAEVPRQIIHTHPEVMLVGVICLAFLFMYSRIQVGWLKRVPPQLWVVPLGIILGRLLHLDDKFLIHIPANPLKHGIVMPDFAGIFANPHMLWTAIGCVITLSLVDGVESLATIMAIDKIDPFRRKSNPNRTLFAMGVSNICSSLAGGLTIIPGGIKSTTCIMSGGRTLWANFFNACFLILFLLCGQGLLNMIPVATLGAVLTHIGWKLCNIKKWRHVASIGHEQMLIFASTVVVTLATDLLIGLAVGMMVKLVLVWSLSTRYFLSRHHVALSPAIAWHRLVELFSNPVCTHHENNGIYMIRFRGPVVCFNSMHLNAELAKIPAGAKTVNLYFSPSVGLIDHSSACRLLELEAHARRAGNMKVQLIGFDQMRMQSKDETCMRSARIA